MKKKNTKQMDKITSQWRKQNDSGLFGGPFGIL